MNNNKSQKNIPFNIANSEPSYMKKSIRYLFFALLLLAATWMIYVFFSTNNSNKVTYITEAVKQDKLVVLVSATGQLQPVDEIEVGSEISGLIETVFVDENDYVKRGQVLAKLDTAKLIDSVTKSKAALASAKAQVSLMQATVTEAAASLARLHKVSELSGGKVPSKTEMETAEATLLRAYANKESADASVTEASATLNSEQTNLSKASIRSPIDGIVLTRKIESGQTVTASLETPVLFTLAKNLTQMELQVDVDEADVGQVKAGQSTFFTVDAWPGRQYPAKIVRVGYGSQTKDNVVTYKTILKVSNDDLTLRPGMTATAEITTSLLNNAVLVPNEALRFTPPQTEEPKNSGGLSNFIPSPPQEIKQKKPLNKNSALQQVWVLHGDNPVAVAVKVGLTDSRYTEVLSGDLRSGMQVITEFHRQPK